MNGCHSRPPFREWHMAQDGYTSSRPDSDTRTPRMVKVPHVMSRDCMYSKLNQEDEGCYGCTNKYRSEQ